MPTKKQIDETKELSITEGASYSVMSGFGTNFITPFALRLGATVGDIGLLQTLPELAGSAIQLFYSKITSFFANRKQFIQSMISVQAFAWLALIALPFVANNWAVSLAILIYSIGIVAERVANPAWTSWMADVVREKDRGRYFGKRNEIAGFAAFLSMLTAGAALGFFNNTIGWVAGFAILFIIAFAARANCILLFKRMTEPKTLEAKGGLGFREFCNSLFTTSFGRLTLYRAALLFAVDIASPYFAVYALTDLHFDYLTYGVIFTTMQITYFLTMPYWGELSRRLGDKTVLYASGFLCAIYPLSWALFKNPAILFFTELLNGVGWAGQMISTTNLVMKTAPEKSKSKFVAYYNLFLGIAVFAGAMVGAVLISYFDYHSFLFTTGIPAVFLISIILRFAAVFLIPKINVDSKPIKGKKQFLKTITVYPILGAVHEIHLGFSVGLEKARKLKKRF